MPDRESITITLMSGPKDGLQLSFPAPEGGTEIILTIGRNENCDIALTYDSQVSRSHARVFCISNNDTVVDALEEAFGLTFELEDVDSRNGTFLGEGNPQRLTANERVTLDRNQLFRVGRTWMRVDP